MKLLPWQQLFLYSPHLFSDMHIHVMFHSFALPILRMRLVADRAILYIVIAVVVIISNKFDHGEGAIPLFHAITAAWAVCGFKNNG